MRRFWGHGGCNRALTIQLNVNIMNLNKIQKLTKSTIIALAFGMIANGAAPVQAGEKLTGLTYIGGGAGTIFSFDSTSPANIFNAVAISGAQSGEVFVGIDYYSGTLYGVGSFGRLYNINQTTGAASFIGAFGTLTGIYYGMDASAAGIRIVSDGDINLLVNPSTGALISSTPSLNASLNVNAIATTGSLTYVVDSSANTLSTLNTSTGNATLIGPMGYDVSAKNGFDISPVTGTAYFASGVSSSALDANLYTVDLSTGIAILVGTIGPGDGMLVYGLTVVPEPSIVSLFVTGGAGLGLLTLLRRRK